MPYLRLDVPARYSLNGKRGLARIAATRVRGPICLLLALAFIVALLPSWGANPADNVHRLLPHTTGAALAAVKQAFENGEIVEMAGNQADFDSLLSIAIPDITPVASTTTFVVGKRSVSYTTQSTPRLQWEAARLAPDGIHVYQCATSKLPAIPPTPNPETCATSLQKWIAQEQDAGAQVLPEPEVADWTYLGQISLAYADDHLTWDNRVRLFRLNDIDSQGDWYMIVRDPLSTPNYKGCVAFGACGWFTKKRDFQISLDRSLLSNPQFKMYEWSPQQEIKSGTGELSLGFSLDSVVPKPGVGYTFSWSQSDVDTTVYAAPTQKETSWVENFASRVGLAPPPVTSRTGFTSHQGVIFQVPEGTTSFTATGNTYVEVTYEAGGLEFWGVEAKPTFHLAPPQFSTSVSNLNLLQNSTGLVYLTSEIPYYSQRLRWTLVSKPDWLDVSPTQGAGSAYLEIRDNGAAQPGNVGYIELQTDPAYGAPTVSSGPLRVKVQVVPGITQEGVLLAGGLDASGQPLNSAEVWNPSTKTTVSTYPMLTPRDRHTATLLPDGTILLAGGRLSATSGLEKAEYFDPNSARFYPLSPLNNPRYDHTATLFPDGPLAGKVLVVGGCCDSAGKALTSAELYDPATQQFTLTGSMTTPRMNATATLLDTGYVLITGGAASPTDYKGTAKAELYNPATQTFLPTGDMQQARRNHSASRLVNGQVLVAGGFSTPVDPLKNAEIYNPGDGQFVLTGSMPVGRRWQASTLMPNGLVLIDGGWNSPETGLTFDVSTGLFTQSNNSMSEFRDLPTATLIANTETAADGKVLLAGGAVLDLSTKGGKGLDLFNPATGSFEPAGNMSNARNGMTATAFGQNQ